MPGMNQPPPLADFSQAADELRRQEFARLAAAVVPTIEGLRALSARQLRARVTTMLEQLGYELLTSEMAADLVARKDGAKYVVALASTTEQTPTHQNQLTRLHSAVIAANATAGFFITTRGFTRDAEAYAATAPLKLVDGPKLIASIKRGMEGAAMPDSYKAMCRQCGEIVTHTLDRSEAIPCSSGHPVAPTIARATLVIRKQEGGSTSRTYTPPRQYTRREVNAHNSKYIAKMKRRKAKRSTAEPPEPPEPGADPFKE
jgi:Restriction endonuclease